MAERCFPTHNVLIVLIVGIMFLPIRNALPFRSSPSPRPGSQNDDTDTAYATAITALDITKEVGAMLKDIPYIKGVAGTVLQIIKIGDVSDQSITGCFDRSLIDTHRRLSKTGIVVRSLLRSSESIRLPCFVHWIKFLSQRKRTN